MALPPMTQTPNSLTELTRLMSGDLSGSLTSGDKLLALSGLLRSATRSGRRAGLTPEQVIGGLQQRKVAEVQNRLAIEQQRAQMAQAQRAKALREQMRDRLTPEQQGQFDLLSDQQVAAMAGKRLESELMPSPEQISGKAREISEATGFAVGSPEHRALMQQYLSQPQLMSTPAGIVQIAGLMFPQSASQSPQPQARILQQRPSGLTDDELFARAREAVEGGANVDEVFRQLRAWGVNM
jgi:hypothetical protein